MHFCALRVDTTNHMPDDATLARGIHRLQHQQHVARSPRTALGVETFLQPGKLTDRTYENAPPLGLATLEAGCCRRVNVGENKIIADAKQ